MRLLELESKPCRGREIDLWVNPHLDEADPGVDFLPFAKNAAPMFYWFRVFFASPFPGTPFLAALVPGHLSVKKDHNEASGDLLGLSVALTRFRRAPGILWAFRLL